MCIPNDCFVLCPNRSSALVAKLLNDFLFGYSETTLDYGVPALVDNPQLVFKNLSDLISYLCDKPSEWYRIYLKLEGEVANMAVIAFGEDGSLIVGLLNVGQTPISTMVKLAKCLSARFAYITHEGQSPESHDEFMFRCTKGATIANYVDGETRWGGD